ncbi:regulatory protein GemA [Gemmobacter fulvus]|uniref:gp16 family protein n=1 Tax=Gemmobacter fulvus TaxID=2840474 RepID=UPI0027965329|nr:regulatory protein GemA [Gemmobacter fulvus]MDQ1847688.1 regulatory protein GemA [Gemmobacter fulvus]
MGNRTLQRMIHVGCKQLGLDEDTRRGLQLVTTGKSSMAEMTDGELLQVVEALKARGFTTGFKAAVKGRRAPASRADLRLIHVLWGLLGQAGLLQKPGRDGLNAFVRSRFEGTWQSVPIDIDALRDADQINDVIRALKDWCKRARIPTKERGA